MPQQGHGVIPYQGPVSYPSYSRGVARVYIESGVCDTSPLYMRRQVLIRAKALRTTTYQAYTPEIDAELRRLTAELMQQNRQ
ncbi:hypothetical protein FHL15_010362 [Xylaria flabelliformis]|uniref:Uncharacterized protein n=1 Tax=Xylaria flabelliformis TaxID=2512241 RepID=A0A553HLF7_9PEZI|nr:hypothetical protein FHL15_010362 [Xylaria flabelliformis]